MIKTRITDMLGIEHPVIQGAMAYLASAELAAAVSNAGGLGVIAAGLEGVDQVRAQIKRARALTDKIFGVNIMLLNPQSDDLAQICVDEHVKAVFTGAGNPGKYIARWKEAGMRVIPVAPNAALALRMERAGADAVVIEGTEAGGHIGDDTTLCLVPNAADKLKVPIIAAGGIADGRTMAACLLLGAQAVQVGTAFVCAEECPAHPEYKRMIIEAGDCGTMVTGRNTGHPVRAIKTKFMKKLRKLEADGGDVRELELMTKGSYPRACFDGDVETGTFFSGQIASLIKEVRPARRIIHEMTRDAENILRNFARDGGVRFE